jgi:predicted adenylyl cyclase CyaB
MIADEAPVFRLDPAAAPAMTHLNVEFKARCSDLDAIRRVLEATAARRVGADRQVDTYFRARRGRLKLREGGLENALIHYEREDTTRPKVSRVSRHPVERGTSLKGVLAAALGVLVVVDKRREVYLVDNVRIHLDEVEGLGTFVEVEAVDADGTLGAERLTAQCRDFLDLLRIPGGDLVANSYSDLVRGLRPASP